MFAIDNDVLSVNIVANAGIAAGNAMTVFQYAANGGAITNTATTKLGFTRSVQRKIDNWDLEVTDTLTIGFSTYSEYYFYSGRNVTSRSVSSPVQTAALKLRNRHVLQGHQPYRSPAVNPTPTTPKPLDVHLIWDYGYKRTAPVFTNPNCNLAVASNAPTSVVSVANPIVNPTDGTDFFEFMANIANQVNDYAVYQFTVTSTVPNTYADSDFEGERTITSPVTVRVLKTRYTQTGIIEPMTAGSGHSHWECFSQNNMLYKEAVATAILNSGNFVSRENVHSFEVPITQSVVRALSYTMPELSGNANVALGFFIEYKADEYDEWHPMSNSTIFCRKAVNSIPHSGGGFRGRANVSVR